MKKLYLIFVCIAIFSFVFTPISQDNEINFSYAQESQNGENNTEKDIQDEVETQLDNFDFSNIDDLISALSSGQLSIFGCTNFYTKIIKLIKGDYDTGEGVLKAIFSCFLETFLSLLPFISLIVAISVLESLLQGIKPSSNGKSVSNVIHFVVYGIVIILVLSRLVKMVALTTKTILSVKSQMDFIFPILLTFLTAVGGTVSASLYQPAMALLSSFVMDLFTVVLLPIFIFSIVFNIVSNLSINIKLDKFTLFLNSSYKWILGMIFTIFSAFLSIQGISASSVDGVSIRTAKYAIKSYVPLVGSYISDGMGIILASSNLIKNAVGGAGLLLLVVTVLSPLFELILFMLALKLISGIIEPLGNKQIANFINSLSKSMTLLIALIISISFIYFIMIGLVMCSANIF